MAEGLRWPIDFLKYGEQEFNSGRPGQAQDKPLGLENNEKDLKVASSNFQNRYTQSHLKVGFCVPLDAVGDGEIEKGP